MLEARIHAGLLFGLIAVSIPVFVLLFFVSAPYGRHFRKGWGASVGSMTGWLLMEVPAAFVFAACVLARGWPGPVEIVFLALWQAHYLNRAFVYPLRTRSSRRVPLLVVFFAVTFNVMNGYLNGRHIGLFSSGYPVDWLWDPRFIAGTLLFVSGFALNLHSDEVLLRARRRDPGSYCVPHGGAFDLVSCPNYLGEILEWIGWAIATWSLPGLAFCLWTAANLVPRAWANHHWYRATFPDYPAGRKALVPFVF